MRITEHQVQIIKEYFSDKPVKNIYVFGSYARGEADEQSDIDIVFSLEEGARMSYFGLARFQLDLEEMLERKVDLVEKEYLFPSIMQQFELDKLQII